MSAAPIRRLLGPGEPLLGTRLVVRRALGQGGMGEVYEVEHVDLGRRFAVKLLHRLHAGRPDLAARMRAEARSVARLRHPNLVDVFDLGATADGRTYFVMELLCGRDLRAELAGARYLEVAAALACMEQALEGLAAAHEAGIVHRDVKLENLFLCEGGLLKLLDFGVAKLDSAGAWQTAADALVGTPRTMAPEQCRPGPVDARADLYAAGLALYELVTGRGPFDDLRGQPDALRFAHCDRPPPPPSRIAPQPIPPDVERIILRALEKSPARRFQTAREMAAEIRLALARLDEPSPDLRALSSASLPASASVPVPASAPVSVPVAVSVAVPVPASVSVSVSASVPDIDPTEIDLAPHVALPVPAWALVSTSPARAKLARALPAASPPARPARPRLVPAARRPRLAAAGPRTAGAAAPGALALCALAVASAALGLAVAQRLPGPQPPGIGPSHIEERSQPAVR